MFIPDDTAIEEAFDHAYYKHARSDYPLSRQVEFNTFCGVLRVDFVVQTANRRIGFECDGREFHDRFRDEVRDAVLLGEQHLDTIYHMGGSELYYAPEIALEFIRTHDAFLFEERVEKVLRSQIKVCGFRRFPYLYRHCDPSLTSARQHWPFIFRRMKLLNITRIDDYVAQPALL